MVTDGNRPWWFTASGASCGAKCAKALSGTFRPLGAAHVDLAQDLRILPEFRRHLHDHVILVQRRVHGGDLALAEGIVKRVVDQLRRDAEARGGGAVVLHPGLQAVVLLIAVHVGDDGNGAQLLEHAGRVLDQILQIVAAHGELVVRGAGAAAHAQVLRGLQNEQGARHARQFGPQPRDDLVGGDLCVPPSGFSEMNMRPMLLRRRLPPLPPVKPLTVSTAGSAATICTICRRIRSMAWNEVSWSA